jgi:VanZ family protein
MRLFLIYHLPVLLYAGAVLAVSSIPNLKSPHLRFLAFDKAAHLVEYAIFAFLALRSARNLTRDISLNRAALVSVLFLACFALLDETYQYFVPGRRMDPLDILVDFVGSFAVVAALWIRAKSAKKARS